MTYLTAAHETSAEQTIERSRFIAYVRPVNSREEAEQFIAEIRRMHRDARHNVPAFVIGEESEQQWASDDGEPSGTSGMPVLRILTGRKLTNTAIVITRYFGGIKLGTGGLMRAYTSTASEALDRAGVCEYSDRYLLIARITYSQYDRVRRAALEAGYREGENTYDDMVTLSLSVAEEEQTAAMRMLIDLTGGALSEESISVKKIKEMREITS